MHVAIIAAGRASGIALQSQRLVRSRILGAFAAKLVRRPRKVGRTEPGSGRPKVVL